MKKAFGPTGTRGKVTLEDVAVKAGVGIATVDRVVNERENVSATTRKKVLDAARALALRRILPETYHRSLRIEVLLARPDLPLIARMNVAFRGIGLRLPGSVVLHRTLLDDEAPETLARALERTDCAGVIVYAQDHPLINDAISALQARGVAVVTMISDLPAAPRVAYAGIDHYRAGRTAAAFMARAIARPGPVVVLCNHLGFESHASRVKGFVAYAEEHGAPFHLAEIVEGRDDRDRSEARLRRVFAARPDIVGVYNVGAANRAVAAAISAGFLDAPPVFIGHELTRHTAKLLRDGVMTLTIDQAPEQQAQCAVDVLLGALGFAGGAGEPVRDAPDVPILVYCAENVPAGFGEEGPALHGGAS